MSSQQKPIASMDEPEGFGVLGEKYLSHLAVQQGSPRTIDDKRWLLHHFANWCQARSLDRPEQLTTELAIRYQRHLYHQRKDNGQPLAIATQRNRMTSIKMFYHYLVKAGYLNYSPLAQIELPKLPQQLPRAVLSEAEAETIFKQANINTDIGLRDRAIMETLYSTGIRRAECLQLKINDIDQGRGLIHIIQGKGRKDRVIPIGARALHWITHYLNESRPELIKHLAEPVLFLSRRGTALHPHTLSGRLHEYIKQSGINKPGSVHIFRHTTATLMLENGADIRHIQAQLGHADLSTTQVYTQVAITHLKAVHERTHPGRLSQQADDENNS